MNEHQRATPWFEWALSTASAGVIAAAVTGAVGASDRVQIAISIVAALAALSIKLLRGH